MPKNDWLKLAIFVDENEAIAPSNKEAIQKFVGVGKEKNIESKVLNPYKMNFSVLDDFDAFFIRTTTQDVENHVTRKIANYADISGAPCLDDIRSISIGSNKIRQAELFIQNGVTIPITKKCDAYSYHQLDFKFPCIIKNPFSCFSGGVYKANDRQEYLKICARESLYSHLLIQEYIETEFDWRIIILDEKPIAALKYYMVKDDFRILVQEENGYRCGDFECVTLKKVPPMVIDQALKSSRCVGHGLYGVDLKEKDGIVYVIEVNDNPDIDAGIEDCLEGDKIYSSILDWFLDRCEDNTRYFP